MIILSSEDKDKILKKQSIEVKIAKIIQRVNDKSNLSFEEGITAIESLTKLFEKEQCDGCNWSQEKINQEIAKARKDERIKVYNELGVLHGKAAKKFFEDMKKVDKYNKEHPEELEKLEQTAMEFMKQFGVK